MCRSIKRLRQPAGVSVEADEIEQAARQFVRKISGIQHPSSRTQDAFQLAVRDISLVAERLLDDLPPLQRPRATTSTTPTARPREEIQR